MRGVLIFFIFLTPINAISQKLVKGIVYDLDGIVIPGAKIAEIGTNSKTQTTINGQFELTTLSNPGILTISWIGFEPQAIEITSDTTLTIVLNNDFYDTRWLTFRTNYEFINSAIGLQLSNGVDEEPLIHFEDFRDNILIKIQGHDNYAYGAEIGVYSLRLIGRTTLKYDIKNFENSDLFLTDFKSNIYN